VKIVTATELFLANREDEKQRAFEDFIKIVKLENTYFTDHAWTIANGELDIDIDEAYYTVDNQNIESWLERNAVGSFNSDKYLTIYSFN